MQNMRAPVKHRRIYKSRAEGPTAGTTVRYYVCTALSLTRDPFWSVYKTSLCSQVLNRFLEIYTTEKQSRKNGKEMGQQPQAPVLH
jgi:hypothetical protein